MVSQPSTHIMQQVDSYDFTGLYEMSEASLYLRASRGADRTYRVDSSKLIRWIRKGLSDRELIHVRGGDLLIGFEDLISLRIIAALRSAGISFNVIYEAERWLRDVFYHPRPFATEAVWTEGSQVFVQMCDRLIAASRAGQIAFELLRDWLIPVHGLAFDSQGIVLDWEPQEGVLLAPDIQLGAPCVKGTSIPTSAVWGMVGGGDSVEYVMRAYRLERQEVESVIEWESKLRGLEYPVAVGVD